MNKALNPAERIQQAFLQLEFAIKLVAYIELGKLDKQIFDRDTVIWLDEGNLNFGDNTFHSYDDVILAAQNNYIITLGFSAIALETSLQKHGLKHDPNDLSTRGQLRTLVYMIRCAFAHDMMTPCWRIDARYQQVFDLALNKRNIRIDLRQLNGKAFQDSDIGGIGIYFEIKNAVCKIISEA